MRLGKALIFVPLALGVHAGISYFVPMGLTGTQASGASGADAHSVEAASPAQAALVARWQKVPEIAEATAQPVYETSTAQSHQSPTVPLDSLPTALPVPSALTMPEIAAAPRLDTTLADRPKKQLVSGQTRPKARPESQVVVSKTALLQKEQRATGEAKTAQRGSKNNDATQSKYATRSNALRANWGALIIAKVKRNMIYPHKASGEGTAKLALKVASNGKLQDVSLVRSSGNAMFDKAAFRAVKRAGRFAKAPSELEKEIYAFNVSLTFSR